MVRNYKRKRESVEEDAMQRTVSAVIDGGMHLREAGDMYGIKHNTLFYRVKKFKENPGKTNDYSSLYTVNQVFTTEQEDLLQGYIIKCSKMNYGLNYIQIRQIAFEYSDKLGCCPEKWKVKGIAGLEWMKSYMKRHPRLSLRKPENTSMARATSFTKKNIEEFQHNLKELLEKFKFVGDRIFNLDETGVTTTVQAPHVVAETGVKQVGQVVSAERGQLLTMCAIVSASGNTLPPVFVFPRARMHAELMANSPEGSIGLANSPTSGWMTTNLFLKVLEHIKQHTRCSKEDHILLLLDNHESHCSLDAILYSRDSGIIMCTFPPHCTHRLRPLDVAVLGPFKTKLAQIQNDWLLSNPGSTISIPRLPGLIKSAFDLTFTRSNILSAFKKTGIWPFYSTVFDEEFTQASILSETSAHKDNSLTNQETGKQTDIGLTPIKDRSKEDTTTKAGPSRPSNERCTPESIRPYPLSILKEKRNGDTARRGWKKGKSRILTSTPEKNKIEAETEERLRKVTKFRSRLGLLLKNQQSKRRLYEKEPETSSGEFCEEFSDVENKDIGGKENDMISEKKVNFKDFQIRDYVLVKFATKKKIIYYVGEVLDKDKGECVVKFLKKSMDSDTFFFPEKEDKWTVEISDIVAVLPQPIRGTTQRSMGLMTFKVNLSNFRMG